MFEGVDGYWYNRGYSDSRKRKRIDDEKGEEGPDLPSNKSNRNMSSNAMPVGHFANIRHRNPGFKKRKRKGRAPFSKKQVRAIYNLLLNSDVPRQYHTVTSGKTTWSQGQVGYNSVCYNYRATLDTLATLLGVTDVTQEILLRSMRTEVTIHNPMNFPVEIEWFIITPKYRGLTYPPTALLELTADYADFNYLDPNMSMIQNPEFSRLYRIKGVKKETIAPGGESTVVQRKRTHKQKLLDYDVDTDLGIAATDFHPLFSHHIVWRVMGTYGYDATDIGSVFMNTMAGQVGHFAKFYVQYKSLTDVGNGVWEYTQGVSQPTRVVTVPADMEVVEHAVHAVSSTAGV